MPPGPMLGSKSQSEKQKEEESERQNGNDGPAGKYSSRSSKGGGGGGGAGIYAGQKATMFSQLFIWKQTAQAGTVKLHLGVEWILSRSSKKKKTSQKKNNRFSMCGPVLQVRTEGSEK